MTRRRAALAAALALAVLPLGGPARGQDAGPPLPPGAGDDLRRTAVVRAVEAVSPAVVNIATDQIRVVQGFQNFFDAWEGRLSRRLARSRSLGSGIVIDARGIVLTNHHVVAQGSAIHVKFRRPDGADDPQDEGLEAKVIAADPQNDLALLRIERPGPYPVVRMGSSHDLLMGEPAIAIGNPFGFSSTVTAGVISAVNRNIPTPTGTMMEGMIQTDASIDPGNSGGPLLDISGRLVGVNTAVFSEGRNIGFAIPVDRVKSLLGHLVDPVADSRSWAGFEVENRGEETVVDTVDPEGPAAHAGLRPGDVVLDCNGVPAHSVYALKEAALGRNGVDTLVFHVRRRGAEGPLAVKVALAEHPGLVAIRRRLGVEAEPVLLPTAEGGGVLRLRVREVLAGGAADRIGVAAGDALYAVDGSVLGSAEDARHVLRGIPRKQVVPVMVLRQTRAGWRSATTELSLD